MVLGPEGNLKLKSFGLTNDKKKSYDKVMKAFKAHSVPKVNESFERYKFNKRCQLPGEPFETFLTAIKNLSATCNFEGSEKDKSIRDRILLGLQASQPEGSCFHRRT